MFSATLALAGLIVFWLMLGLFLIAAARHNAGVVDIGWGFAVVTAVVAAYLWQQPVGLRAVLVLVLVAVWGMRLVTHVVMRDWGSPEHWRYARLRTAWGNWYVLRSFVSVFALRAVMLVLVAAPALWVVTFGGPMSTWVDYFGLVVWVIGYAFETIADFQLMRFMKTPSNHGRMLMDGLWHYSRHPNYFGELMMWWGIWFIALSVPGGWVTIIGPLALSGWILLRSIPLVESHLLENAEYRAYARRTSELLPWF
ncbi:MAG TPA: DUF1295 domain-containing protein [Candidatus Paceibacterota bacterium]|nr:DUF1295 domain-containing protein [Candidatus Paceibacterota bacterium]